MTEVSAGTLTDFLLARLSDDEAAAREESERRRVETLTSAWAFGVAHLTFGGPFDPARVLAECEAKRQIVAEYQRSVRMVGESLSQVEMRCLQYLASVYAGHAEFNPAWRL